MSKLIVRCGVQNEIIEFDKPSPLAELLEGKKLSHPCGGHGLCGKCAVLLSGDVSQPNSAEQKFGCRLSCQAIVFGDSEVILPSVNDMVQIENGSLKKLEPVQPMSGKFGAAIDIGTTTVVLCLYDLSTGNRIAEAAMLNPQTSVSADVIGRIDYAMHGGNTKLKELIQDALTVLLQSACARASISGSEVKSLVITGNTTMLYLLTDRDTSPLSRAPFETDFFFGDEFAVLEKVCYTPPCLHAFVGADTTCAILSSGMLRHNETALLCDIGTNGEIALWHKGTLYIASTAAGPAFEGAGIRYGCGSVYGAIDSVEVFDNKLSIHTIGGGKAVGICGSGLIDAAAALLDIGALDETGFLQQEEYILADSITITRQDIRALQLAKAAVAAGISCLLVAAGCSESEVSKVHLAGGFGKHLNIRSAERIGLIPSSLADRIEVIGNAAIDGAAMLLLDTSRRSEIESLRGNAQHIRLDCNAEFSQRYVDEMFFPER